MLRGLYSAASGMIANQRRSEALTNNMANLNSTGYKADDAVFRSFPDYMINEAHEVRPPLQSGAPSTESKNPLNSVSALRSMQSRMDTIGNNIANVNTHGFRSQDTTFGSVLTQVENTIPKDAGGNRLTPPGLHVGNGAVANMQRFDYSMGTPEQTNLPTDLYMDGNAYFQVMVNGNEPRYTRMGDFTLSQDANGQTILTTKLGHPVMSTTGTPITIPEGFDFQVDGNGKVTFVNKSNKSDMQPGPDIALYTIPNRSVLESKGDGEFTVPQNAAAQPTLSQDAKVKQGYLESSNVDLQREMTNLLETQRMFQFNSRALSFIDQMDGIINNINSK